VTAARVSDLLELISGIWKRTNSGSKLSVVDTC